MSDKPVISPTAEILRDDKAILVFVGMIIETLIVAVPTLAPYAGLLTLVTFVGIGYLVLHMSIEDLIYAWADAKSTVTVTTSSIAGTAGTSESRTIETVKPGVPPVDTTPFAVRDDTGNVKWPAPLPPDAGAVG